MKDFDFEILHKLYATAKTAKYNKQENELVFISKRRKNNDEVTAAYEAICELFNGGEPMTNKKLLDILQRARKNSRVILKRGNEK